MTVGLSRVCDLKKLIICWIDFLVLSELILIDGLLFCDNYIKECININNTKKPRKAV